MKLQCRPHRPNGMKAIVRGGVGCAFGTSGLNAGHTPSPCRHTHRFIDSDLWKIARSIATC